MAKRIPILVIDDDSEFQQLIEDNLRMAGFEVWQALDGPEGLKIARKKKPHVILLDVTMPEMDGLQVLTELKNSNKTKDIPVIMLTAKSLMEDIDHAFDLGAYDYITKPVLLKTLGQTIRHKLQKQSR